MQHYLKIINEKNLTIYFSFLILLIWWLIFGYNLSNEPYVWDDLHFFREYTAEELKNSWTGNWDSDGVETLSYRPVAVLYYHLIYIIFNENTFLLRSFVILEAFFLILITNNLLNYLNFSKGQIIIFTSLIIFSKIFITLISFFTLSVLIFAYILTILSILFFFVSIDKKKEIFFIISIFLSAAAIFVREELYVIPIILFLLYFFKYEINIKNLYQCLKRISFFLILVFLHMFLRKKFVPDAAHLELIGNRIMFGDNIIGFGGLIKAFKSSFLPMGYYSSQYSYEVQKYFSLIWLILIFLALIVIFKNFDEIKRNLKKISLIILITIACCLPHLTIDRSFGIFLSSIFALTAISALINNLFLNQKNSINNIVVLKRLMATLILIVGIFGGIYRSYLHVESMNQFSKNIVEYDSMFIYGYKNQGIKISIPSVRYEKKKAHLKNLNIFDFNWGLKIEDSSPLIIKNRYHPLSF